MNGHVPALLTDQLSLLSFINYDAVNGTHYNVVAVTSQIAAKCRLSESRVCKLVVPPTVYDQRTCITCIYVYDSRKGYMS